MDITDEKQSHTNEPIFWIYLFLFVASILCSMFIFSQYIFKRVIRTKINNQIILVVLICSFIQVISELPLVLYFFRYNVAWVASDLFCTVWCYIDYVLNVVILLLISYASIQRYLLVFHHTLVSRHLILLHYGPILFCLIYPNLFYFYFIIFYPCANQYDYTKITCQGPCYLFERLPGTFDLFINLVLPLIICILSNTCMISHVFHQKTRMQQQNKWKKNRNLLFQLLCIVIVHNIIWLPIIICLLINLFSPVPQQVFIDLSVTLFTYSIYMVIMLCPFISLVSIGDFRQMIFLCVRNVRRTQTTIQPITHQLIHRTTAQLQGSSKTFN